jgi:hypothetical protein
MLKIVCFLLVTSVYSQCIVKDNSIYVFNRSTDLKREYIAKDFNQIDTLSTHIGIGFKTKEGYLIYNVSNDKVIDGTALIVESLESFISIENISYYSIWKIKLKSKEFLKFKKVLKYYKGIEVTFDYDFTLKNDNRLYCSEFVYNVLNDVDNLKFSFKPKTVELNPFYGSALKREVFKYIPVDFFQTLGLFIKIEEHYIN